MEATGWLALSGVVVAVVSGIFTLLQTIRVQRSQDRKVDAEAYDRAMKFYSTTIAAQDQQLIEIRAENLELRAENKQFRKRLDELEVLVEQLKRPSGDGSRWVP